MKIFLLIRLNMLSVLAFSQSGDTVFTVKMPQSSVSITPKTDVIYKDISKRFKVIKSAGMKIDTIMFTGGTIQRKDSFIYLKSSKTGAAILKIYEKTADDKSSLAFIKEFTVQKFVEPKPNLDGVDADSAIHKMRVTMQGYLSVPKHKEDALKRISWEILSFEMLANIKGRLDTMAANGNRLTFQMRDVIDKMESGNVIDIQNIKYKIAEDTFTVKQPLRIYLIDEPVNKF